MDLVTQFEQMLNNLAAERNADQYNYLIGQVRPLVNEWSKHIEEMYLPLTMEQKVMMQMASMFVCMNGGIGPVNDETLRTMIMILHLGYWLALNHPEVMAVKP